MKIAIIGSGIAGLTAAHKLDAEHQVTLFEASDRLGGHTDTHDLNLAGERYAVDSGFIVFNELNYPHFTQLLDELGVTHQPSDMSFSVCHPANGLEYNTAGLDALFAQRRNLFKPRFYALLRDIARFYRNAGEVLADPRHRHSTLEDYLVANGYSDAFIEDHIYPMTGALWSATPQAVKTFPVRHLVAFMQHHRMLQVSDRPQWRVVCGGARSYVDKLTAALRGAVRPSTPVRRLTRHGARVTVTTARGESEVFDKAVLACHSDQALALLADATEVERSVLGAIPYQPNEMVLHSDTRYMPVRRKAWASWNALAPAGAGHEQRCSVTYWMNRLQNLDAPQPFLVTLNPPEPVAPQLVWQRRIYSHPLFTPEAVAAQARWAEIDGAHATHFCGAYWGWGFHEDGVRSALNVVDRIGGAPRHDAA